MARTASSHTDEIRATAEIRRGYGIEIVPMIAGALRAPDTASVERKRPGEGRVVPRRSNSFVLKIQRLMNARVCPSIQWDQYSRLAFRG